MEAKLVYSFACGGLDLQNPAGEGRFTAEDVNLVFVGAGPSAIYIVNGWEGLPWVEFAQHVEFGDPDGRTLVSTDPIGMKLSVYGYGVAHDLVRFHATKPGHHGVAVFLNKRLVHNYTVHISP